ncbi:2-oxoglutarate dehydrogenase E1 component [Desulfobacterales bacterium HSG16]|nr:2-oxoglutarate dehydrogenase E1 component [Desulfobacterales bacterium HSG16]
MELSETLNMEYIDAQYQLWKDDPNLVSEDWQFFFKGFEIGYSGKSGKTENLKTVSDDDTAHSLQQARVESLIYRYRDIGHLLACMDPLSACPADHPLLALDAFNLGVQDLEKSFFTRRFSDSGQAKLKDIINILKSTYCRSVAVEYMHLQDPAERRWLQDRMEPVSNHPDFEKKVKVKILEKLFQSAVFEQFLTKKYVGVTRFSLEGGDAVIPLLHTLVERNAAHGCHEIILGMAHRGRLNVLANILQKPYEEIFAEFESCYDPDELTGAGDVKYHNGYLADLTTADGHNLRLFLVNNPSHLEAVDPVVEGIARARQDMSEEENTKGVLPVLLHGDAAFAGQGIVPETLNMSQLKGYSTSGTIHVIINNQIGYTTLPEDARSSRYATDVAKMLMVPIFHVHGEDPEAVAHIAELASDYRNRFAKDVVIDLICYRRFGHNEGDEPYFTQPMMYDRIRTRPPVNKLYADKLIEDGLVGKEDVDLIEKKIHQDLDRAFEEISGDECPFPESRFFENWEGFYDSYSHKSVNTGVEEKKLLALSKKLNTVPDDFSLHPKLARLLKKRMAAMEEGKGIDWANAESLAFASILSQGSYIRLSGQDVGRGTFSHRHSVLMDRKTGEKYVPLNNLEGADAKPLFHVFNSHLSEEGVLGFEYGYAMIRPEGLTIWEAQFGDFANGAQNIIDLFIASGQSKWQRSNGLVMLLPHGWDGLGPEHSSARLERFLQLCAEDNIQVCNITTPAQYFHILRRQVTRNFRKPLIIMSPKSLLRHPLAVSDLSQLTEGHFKEVLDDPKDLKTVRKVILCSGKIYYQLFLRRQELNISDTVLIRLEQFYPFPKEQLTAVTAKCKDAQKWLWVQEEPENMGGWQFVRHRIEDLIEKPLEYIGRKSASSPATGFPAIYKQEQAAISEQALGIVD